jgi:hypothetical protein
MKSITFVRHEFSRKSDSKPYPKFYMKKGVLCICPIILETLMFTEWTANFGAIGISRCFMALGRVQRSIQHRNTSSLLSFDRYTFYLAACGIWRWVVHLSCNSSQNLDTGNRKVLKKSQATRPPLYFTSRLFQTIVCVAIGQDLTHHVTVFKMIETCLKE